MFKFLLYLFACLLFCSECFAQDEAKSPPTNFDEFVAKHDGFVKIEDFNLTRLVLQIGVYADTRIRRVSSESEVKLYYQIEYDRLLGSIAAENLHALVKAFNTLKKEMAENLRPAADHLVYKYSDRDGAQLGYAVEGKKLTWLVIPHKHYDRVMFIKDPYSLEESLTQAVARLEQLK